MPKSFLTQLDWRFATKKFDPEKKVSDDNLAKICDAIRLAPTSFGLQPFHVEIITDSTLRLALGPASYNQAQVRDASHVLIFCVRRDVPVRIKEYIALAYPENKEEGEHLELKILRAMGGKSEQELFLWAARQAYIALGFGLAAAAELGVDSCAMEGFNTAEVDRLLGLPSHLNSVVYMTLGYRAEEAPTKIRFSEEELFSKK